MMAFPLVPVAYAEGKPGNVFFYDRSRAGPGNGFKTPTRPDSFAGGAGRGQGNPGQGTGEVMGHSADLDRGPAAGQRGSGNRAGQGGQGTDGARGTGARFAGERDG